MQWGILVYKNHFYLLTDNLILMGVFDIMHWIVLDCNGVD